jgi:mannitol-specific phosphotransferase system IIBC component
MDYSYSAKDGFTFSVDNFVSAIIGFAAMVKYFIVAGYSFQSAVNNNAIRRVSIYTRCCWLRCRIILTS